MNRFMFHNTLARKLEMITKSLFLFSLLTKHIIVKFYFQFLCLFDTSIFKSICHIAWVLDVYWVYSSHINRNSLFFKSSINFSVANSLPQYINSFCFCRLIILLLRRLGGRTFNFSRTNSRNRFQHCLIVVFLHF